MAMSTTCQTPGAQFHTTISENQLVVAVDFGRKIPLDEDEAKLLEANAHNALEQVLARYYAEEDTRRC